MVKESVTFYLGVDMQPLLGLSDVTTNSVHCQSHNAFCTSYLETKQTPIEEDSTSNVPALVSGVRCAHDHFAIGDECTHSSLTVR